MFFTKSQGAAAVGSVLVDEWSGFFVDLAAGTQKGEARGEGGVSIDFVTEFAGKSEKRG